MGFNLKDYELVKDRIVRFYESYPDGRIITNIDLLEDGKACLCKAFLYLDIESQAKNLPKASGLAFEREGMNTVNMKSWVENCFHKDTDILTFNGWKKISEATENDKIAQVDLFEGNKITFEKPLKKIRQDNQELIRIEDNTTCQVVTPDHNIIIDGIKIKAIDLYNQFLGKFKPLNIENTAYKQCSDNKINKEPDDFILLLNWVMSDGFMCKKTQHIKFGFKKQRKVERLLEILTRLDFKYTTSFSKEYETFRINIPSSHGKKIAGYLPNKELSFETAKNMTHRQAKLFINEFQYTDGCLNMRDGIYLRIGNKTNFDNINFLAFRSGFSVCSPNIEKRPTKFNKEFLEYRVVYKEDAKRTSAIFQKLSGLHTVYCFTMPKGTLITRFNNKITVSSNCETSSIGRAIANMGLVKDARPSREEMEKAESTQGAKVKKLLEVKNG